MKLLSRLKPVFAAWSKSKWVFVTSLLVVSVTALAVLVSAPQLDASTNSTGSGSTNPQEETNSPGKDLEVQGGELSPTPSSSNSPSSTATESGVSSNSTSSTNVTGSSSTFVESASQAAARRAAATYLNQEYQYFRPIFSRVIIIQMLRDDGYSLDDATYASNAVSHNWSTEAALMADELIATGYYSRSTLISELRAENFTSSEAGFAVGELEASYQQNQYWETLWLDQASGYLGEALNSSTNYSEVEANQYLRTAGYTTSECAAVIADISDVYWETSATMSAMDYYYGPDSPTREQVENYLSGRGYSQSQIEYAMNSL